MSKDLNTQNNMEEKFFCLDDNGAQPEIIAREQNGKHQRYKMYKEQFVTIDQILKIYNFMQQNSLDYVTISPKNQREYILNDKDVVVSFGDKEVFLSELEPYDNLKLRKTLEKYFGASEKFHIKQDKKIQKQKEKDERAIENVATNKLAKLRKKIAHNIDETLGTNLEEKKIPNFLKRKVEEPLSQMIENIVSNKKINN